METAICLSWGVNLVCSMYVRKFIHSKRTYVFIYLYRHERLMMNASEYWSGAFGKLGGV